MKPLESDIMKVRIEIDDENCMEVCVCDTASSDIWTMEDAYLLCK